jgi:hypothetical protein
LAFSRKITRIGVPGEDSMTLNVPENVAGNILDLCLPGYMKIGTLYNCRV